MVIKHSYGLLCFKPSKAGFNILMIKKSITYHFCEFIAGKYQKNDDAHLMKLFNNMTYHEKMDILTLSFKIMWYRVYKEDSDTLLSTNHGINTKSTQNAWAKNFMKKKSKFENTFLKDYGNRLKRLIANSVNQETPWEFPRGRSDDKESAIETGIREFCEETGVSDAQFKVLWHVKPYVETYDDFGTTYKNTYYYAEAIGDWEPIYKFNNKLQSNEIIDAQWISKNKLQHMKLEPTAYNRLLKCFNKIIKKYKNAVNTRLV